MKSKGERQADNGRRGGQRRGRPKVPLRSNPRAAKKAFEQRYPDLAVDSTLFRLVGVDPPLSLADEKAAVREALGDRFAAK